MGVVERISPSPLNTIKTCNKRCGKCRKREKKGKGKLLFVFGTVAAIAILIIASKASGGTQDFTLVNKTGVAIHNLFISESAKDDWEEDVLGEEVLEDGESVTITFSGMKACIWEMMVKDEDSESIYWRKIDLCKVEKVVLHCNKKECWAIFE